MSDCWCWNVANYDCFQYITICFFMAHTSSLLFSFSQHGLHLNWFLFHYFIPLLRLLRTWGKQYFFKSCSLSCFGRSFYKHSCLNVGSFSNCYSLSLSTLCDLTSREYLYLFPLKPFWANTLTIDSLSYNCVPWAYSSTVFAFALFGCLFIANVFYSLIYCFLFESWK